MITRVDSFLERDEEEEDEEEGALLRNPKVVVEGVTTPPPLNLCSRRQDARKGLARRSTCIFLSERDLCYLSAICQRIFQSGHNFVPTLGTKLGTKFQNWAQNFKVGTL